MRFKDVTWLVVGAGITRGWEKMPPGDCSLAKRLKYFKATKFEVKLSVVFSADKEGGVS